MKSLRIKVGILVGLFSFLLGIWGCTPDAVDSTGSSSGVITSMSQQERQDYIAKYLKNAYGLDCEISEVKKRPVTMFQNEPLFYTTATIGETWFPVWVNDQGKVTDTAFLLELDSPLQQLLEKSAASYWADYSVSGSLLFEDPPSKKWTAQDDLSEMLKTEPVHLTVRLFLPESLPTEGIKAQVEKFGKFVTAGDGTIFVYYCADPKTIDPASWDWDSYAECVYLTKEGD